MASPQTPPDSSTDEEIEQHLKTSEAEKRGTLPESSQATAAALGFTRAQANPIVRRAGQERRKVLRWHKHAQPSPQKDKNADKSTKEATETSGKAEPVPEEVQKSGPKPK